VALVLGEHRPGTSAGVTYLTASAERNRVQVTLSATVCDDEDEGGVR
jgi:hypothetical protein